MFDTESSAATNRHQHEDLLLREFGSKEEVLEELSKFMENPRFRDADLQYAEFIKHLTRLKFTALQLKAKPLEIERAIFEAMPASARDDYFWNLEKTISQSVLESGDLNVLKREFQIGRAHV